jgi:hypothetical protein
MTPKRCARCNSKIDSPEPKDTLCEVCRVAPVHHSTQALTPYTRHGWSASIASHGIDYGRQKSTLRCRV